MWAAAMISFEMDVIISVIKGSMTKPLNLESRSCSYTYWFIGSAWPQLMEDNYTFAQTLNKITDKDLCQATNLLSSDTFTFNDRVCVHGLHAASQNVKPKLSVSVKVIQCFWFYREVLFVSRSPGPVKFCPSGLCDCFLSQMCLTCV